MWLFFGFVFFLSPLVDFTYFVLLEENDRLILF